MSVRTFSVQVGNDLEFLLIESSHTVVGVHLTGPFFFLSEMNSLVFSPRCVHCVKYGLTTPEFLAKVSRKISQELTQFNPRVPPTTSCGKDNIKLVTTEGLISDSHVNRYFQSWRSTGHPYHNNNL